MKTFKQYFEMFDLVCESPLRINNIRILDGVGGASAVAYKFKEKGKIIGTLTFNSIQVDCFEISLQNEKIHGWLPQNQDICWLYFSFINHDGGVYERSIEQSIATRGFARFVYENFYLKRYMFVESDITHTEKAVSFWRKLTSDLLNKDYKVVVIKGESEIPINIDDFDSLYTKKVTDRESDYRIRIYSK